MRSDQVNAGEVPAQSDTVDLVNACHYLYVGVSGNVKVTTIDGSTFVMVGLAAGAWHKIELARVWSTGTTATSLLVGR